MDITKFGGTTQQRDWVDDALTALTYRYDHPALPCDVAVSWADQATLQGLGDHGSETYFAFTTVNPEATFATLQIWDELDVQTGRFGGKDFYMETVAHELGHVVAGIHSVASASFQSQFAAMVSGTGTWTGGDWEDRYLEAFAEIFKDVFLPERKFDNRTTHKLNRGSFTAYLELVNAASRVYEQPHIDYDLSPTDEHARAGGLWGDPFVVNVGYPFFWGIRGSIDALVGYAEGITGGTFVPLADRSGLQASVLNFDLTMVPDESVDYAQNPPSNVPPSYNANIDPTTWQYAGWEDGWWNANFGPGADPSGYDLARGRRVYNDITGPADVPGGDDDVPLFFVRWELVDASTYIPGNEVAAQAVLDNVYGHLEPLVGQVPRYSGTLAVPPDLRALGFSADCPVRLRIGTSAFSYYTELVGGDEVPQAVEGDDVRPAGPGVTEEWHSRLFTVIFRYRFADPPWPYPASFTVAIPNGPKTRKVQYQGNGWGNRRGSNRRFVGVPSPTVNLDE